MKVKMSYKQELKDMEARKKFKRQRMARKMILEYCDFKLRETVMFRGVENDRFDPDPHQLDRKRGKIYSINKKYNNVTIKLDNGTLITINPWYVVRV